MVYALVGPLSVEGLNVIKRHSRERENVYSCMASSSLYSILNEVYEPVLSESLYSPLPSQREIVNIMIFLLFFWQLTLLRVFQYGIKSAVHTSLLCSHWKWNLVWNGFFCSHWKWNLVWGDVFFFLILNRFNFVLQGFVINKRRNDRNVGWVPEDET